LQLFYLHLQEQIDELDKVVSNLAREWPQTRLLMTHPGVGS
jgi:transposase